MVTALILVAVATATPTPTVTPTPTPTVGVTTAPIEGTHSETYGRKIPAQFRQGAGAEIAPGPTPTLEPNSLAAVAARIKINRTPLAEMPKGPSQSTNKPTSEPAGPTDFPIADEGAIKVSCAAKWPSDYSMQSYCVEKQFAAVKTLQGRTVLEMPLEVFNQIRSGCKQKWADDYSMRDYCETKQIDAWRSLQAH